MSISSRDQYLLQLRPELSSAQVLDETTAIESFQNTALRPILKLQNDTLIRLFLFDLKNKKQNFNQFGNLEKQKSISTHFKSNSSLKQQLLGAVIGLFTKEEFEFYQKDSSKINKRIFSMLKQRFEDQLI
jgi:hypothetical protein